MINRGGEKHTFTEVAEFGGGIVPLLNDLAHVPDVAPECRPDVLEADDFVAPGGTYRETVDQTPHLPVTERAAAEILSLPLYPELPLADVETVAAALNDLIARPA